MIVFEHIRYKNFLSTGNTFTEFPLNRKTATLIIGNNGSGKSTILDAITFVLFGKPYRNINKPQLVNSINGRDCIVEIEFSTNGHRYKVMRGIKPNLFEIHCDGELVNQENMKDYQQYFEESILKANYKSFTQIVILGAASFIPFMQLSPADRRSVVEDLLDIQVFSQMNTLVKSKVSELKFDIESNRVRIEAIKEKIELHKRHLAEINKRNSADKKSIEDELAKKIELLQTTEDKLTLVAPLVVAMQEARDQSNKYVVLLNKGYSFIEKTKSEITTCKDQISIFNNTHECTSCGQGITDSIKHKFEQQQDEKISALEVKLVKAESEFNRIQQLNENLIIDPKPAEEQTQLKYEKFHLETDIKKLQNKLAELNTTVVSASKQESENLVAELETAINARKKLVEDKQYYDVIAEMLKDSGIKARVVKQYIPIINQFVNKYLSDLNFYVNFEMDDTFKEVIKSRHRDIFSYENFSEGEKMRIDLALLFTWRAVSKMKNSINTNIILFDEVFDSSLDANGTDEFLKLLTSFDENVSSFIISHKGDLLIDKFRHVVKFDKVKNFSEVVQ